MKGRIITGAVIALIMVLASWSALSLAAAQSGPKELKIGVVDFKEVFEAYKKKTEFEAKIKEETERIRRERLARNEELLKLQSNVQMFEKRSDERRKAQETLLRKRIEARVFDELSRVDLTRMQRDSIVSIYKDITDVVEEYGRENEFDLIMKRDLPDLDAGNVLELQFQIGSHKLLYSDQALDITAAVMTRLQEVPE